MRGEDTAMEDRISHTQLSALIWAAALAPAAELLPALTLPVAGKGAWMTPLAAAPWVLLSGWLLGRLSGKTGYAAEVRSAFGKKLGGGILILYIVWGELLLSLRLRLCAQRLLDNGRRDGALWYFLLGAAVLSLWIGLGRVDAFARAGQLFLGVLLSAAFAVLLLSLRGVRLERTLPLWGDDLTAVLTAGPFAAGALGWGLYGAFLTGHIRERKYSGRWHWPFWALGGCVLMTAAQWIILGNLGPALAGRLDDPFFALTKSVGVEGAFQRVESVVSALWTLADLSLAALLLISMRIAVKELAPDIKENWTVWIMLGIGGGAGLGAFTDESARRWNRGIVPVGNLALGLGLPFVLWVVQSIAICSSRNRENRRRYRGVEGEEKKDEEK